MVDFELKISKHEVINKFVDEIWREFCLGEFWNQILREIWCPLGW